MANKLKKKVKNTPAKKPANSDLKPFRPEKDEKLDLKAIAGDERTWKIIGAVSLLLAIFLFISFCSYLFTWKEDQAIASQGFSALLDNDKPVANLLGRFGAVMSYFFIFKAFGLASFLICTFFFVVGVNLLFRRKVFSIWRNLKYVTLGLLVLSVSLAFIFSNSDFAFGGGVGNMISDKLVGAMGTFGTAAVLLLLAIGYFIWQFNPALKLPQKLEAKANSNEDGNLETAVIPDTENTSINDIYADKEEKEKKGNSVFADGSVVINFPDEQPMHDFKMIEKDEPEEDIKQEVRNDIADLEIDDEPVAILPPVKEKPVAKISEDALELEIKVVPDELEEEEEEKVVENLPPYEPTLDLRDYKYPQLTLLEAQDRKSVV